MYLLDVQSEEMWEGLGRGLVRSLLDLFWVGACGPLDCEQSLCFFKVLKHATREEMPDEQAASPRSSGLPYHAILERLEDCTNTCDFSYPLADLPSYFCQNRKNPVPYIILTITKFSNLTD